MDLNCLSNVGRAVPSSEHSGNCRVVTIFNNLCNMDILWEGRKRQCQYFNVECLSKTGHLTKSVMILLINYFHPSMSGGELTSTSTISAVSVMYSFRHTFLSSSAFCRNRMGNIGVASGGESHILYF